MRNMIRLIIVLVAILSFSSACARHDSKAAPGSIGLNSVQSKPQAPIVIDVRGLCDDGEPALEILVKNTDDVDHEFDVGAEPWALNAGGIEASAIDYAGRDLQRRPPSLSNPTSGAVLRAGESVTEKYLLEWRFVEADGVSFEKPIIVAWEYYGRLAGQPTYVGGELKIDCSAPSR